MVDLLKEVKYIENSISLNHFFDIAITLLWPGY